MAKIEVLSEITANQIAAGEVVVRPASVVKELVENSLDAGAKNITVRIEKAGKKVIEVLDDGEGIPAKEAHLAFTRHATSKIRSIADLGLIESFGFRGEALASVASVSRVELVTRTRSEDSAFVLEIEGGKKKSESAKPHNPGTLIRVRDLFYNTPARLKFLKADYTEENHVSEAVIGAALANPGVSFRLFLDSREALFFPDNAGLKERLRAIHGNSLFESLVDIESWSDSVKVFGCVAKPREAKNTRAFMRLFVNRRPVSSRALSYAVIEGFGTLLMRGQYPVSAVFVDVNPGLIDVNVHPAKAEVKFRDERSVYNMVKIAVEEALRKADLARDIDAPRGTGAGYDAGRVIAAAAEFSAREHEGERLFDSPAISRSKQEPVIVASGRREGVSIRALGQVHLTYIVGEDEGHLVLIDQHAAHEKVLFEAIMKSMEEGKTGAQELLIPEVMEVSAAEKRVIEANSAVFASAGFAIEPFGESQFKISSQPVLTRQKPCAPFIKEITGLLMEKGSAEKKEVLKDVAASIACRAAIKAGEELNNAQIEGLLREYFEIDEPYSCPHGRPPIVRFSFEEVERMFKRKL